MASDSAIRPRVRGVELLEKVWHVRQAAGDDHPDRDPAADEAAMLVDRQSRAGRGLQRGVGVRENRLADRGDTHRPARAVEQRLAEFALEPADLGADAGLGDVDALRAAVKLRSSATATKYSSWRSSISAEF